MYNNNEKSLSGLIFISIAIVLSVAIAVCGFIYSKKSVGSIISATGSASVDFESDLIVWNGRFSAADSTSAKAYEKIKKDGERVRKYLIDNGITEDEMIFDSVNISEDKHYNYDKNGNFLSTETVGYTLYQSVKITSKNIDKIEKVSRDISSLLESGVEFTSNEPEYYCTTLDSVKLDLIEKATQNAKERINIMARESGASLSSLKSSRLGVFQITAKNSGTSSYGYDGYLDTSSREKTASITVKLEYGVKGSLF